MLQLCVVAMSLVAPPEGAVTVTARLKAETLAVGETYPIEITLELGEGWSASSAGVPNAILQIQPTRAVTLTGEVLRDRRELARNEFLMQPFERMLEPGRSGVEVTLSAEPGAGETIGLNVAAYLRREGDEEAWFVRRRLELPVRPGAEAAVADASVSLWGDDRAGLQIGQKAVPFSLPRADGTRFDLGEHLGRKNIIITTYRAFW